MVGGEEKECRKKHTKYERVQTHTIIVRTRGWDPVHLKQQQQQENKKKTKEVLPLHHQHDDDDEYH